MTAAKLLLQLVHMALSEHLLLLQLLFLLPMPAEAQCL